MSSPQVVDVAVVGGGIAGLAAAHGAHRSGQSVILLEASGRVGGKIAAAELAGGSVDVGPDAFLARVPWAVELCHDLGMADELVEPATGQAWLWTRGRLRALPTGLVLGVPSQWRPLIRSGILSWRGLAGAAVRARVGRRSGPYHVPGDPSVAEAIGRHLGREVVERLVDPLLGGINAGDSERLSLAAAAPTLVAATKTGNLMRALRTQPPTASAGPIFLAPRAGMTALVARLTAALPAGAVRTAAPVLSLRLVEGPVGERVWDLGHGVIARRIVLATPAWVSAALLRPQRPDTADLLDSIVYSSVVLTVFAYRRAEVTLPPGSGMLVPRAEGRLITAASWYDQKWPIHARSDQVLIRVSAGRLGDERALALDDATLTERLHAELQAAIASITAAPIASVVTRWPKAFPQYEPGHGARVEQIMANLPDGVSLVGAPYRGVGMAACIRDGLAAGAASASDSTTQGATPVGPVGPPQTR